ncbi:hypothetical protein BC938DRAFT_474538 [Jimgerdemannia flammicorona]|uniref:Uncharacterized protein n=1 Tax=Jimgerdemannia flammicorona TaxID=994334 RepID=A0A433Q204_9FUNG|nr:hypothetical protein BC938DRAFT_474538 [Jimgerdemannia flammicorona]
MTITSVLPPSGRSSKPAKAGKLYASRKAGSRCKGRGWKIIRKPSIDMVAKALGDMSDWMTWLEAENLLICCPAFYLNCISASLQIF